MWTLWRSPPTGVHCWASAATANCGFASSEQNREIAIRELAGGEVKRALQAKKEAVRNLTFSADGKLLAGVNPDSRESGRYTTVGVWDLNSGKERFAVGGGVGDP